MNARPRLGRCVLLGALIGSAPLVLGRVLLLHQETKAVGRVEYSIAIVDQTPPPKISRAPYLPKGKVVILEAGSPERWRCLVESRFGQEPVEKKRFRRIRRGQAAWVLQGVAKPTTTRVPDLALARRPLVLEATGYDPGPVDNTRGWVGTTKTGERARFGIVAVDPKVIPLGAYLYIEGYGPGLAADVGGAIKGQKIDLCFNSTRQANAWGRRKTRVWRVDPLYGKTKKRWEEALTLGLVR